MRHFHFITTFSATAALFLAAPFVVAEEDSKHSHFEHHLDPEKLAKLEKYRKIFAAAENMEVYEGLPHPYNEPELLRNEAKRKDVTMLVKEHPDDLLYTPGVKATNADELRALFGEGGGLGLYREHKCGFHADYCIKFKHEKKTYHALICFGCYDMVVIGGDEYERFSIFGKKLKPLLAIYDSKRPRYEIIDTHFHAMPNKPSGLDEAVKWLDKYRISRAFDLPTDASLPKNDAERKVVLENFKKHEGRFNRFCLIQPHEVRSEEDAIELLKKEKKDGAIGFGGHFGKGLLVSDPSNMRLFAACAKLKLPVMFQMDERFNKDSEDFLYLETVLETYPDGIFIVHGPSWWKQLPNGHCGKMLEKYPNLYASLLGFKEGVDTDRRSSITFKGRDQAAEFMTQHHKKLLFANECGYWREHPDSHTTPELHLMGLLTMSYEVKSAIFSGNAKRLFGID